MKYINKLSIVALGCASLMSCADLDTIPQGGIFTDGQKQEVVESDPSKLKADITGMYANNLIQFSVFPTSERGDDFGYPAVCLSNDLNGPDMLGPDAGYNWFTSCSKYADRSDTYANPYMRWALFYNQIKLANDILASIPEDTENQALKYYRGQAKAVRAFDYLSLVPYFQFKYKGNEDKPSVPIVKDRMEGDLSNNPRASLKDIYEFILSDLNAAITDLEGFQRTSKGEVDQQVAYGLRARANLYTENWAAAADDATKALQGYSFYSKADISKPAFVSSSEPGWIWALVITEADYNAENSLISWPGVIGSFCAGSYSAGVGMYKTINTLLFNKISATDVRKGWWVDDKLHSNNLNGQKWGNAEGDAIAKLELPNMEKAPFLPYTVVKFGMFGGLGNNVAANHWPIMRAEEMLFIQAEGKAMAGDLNAGKTLLENFVKVNRDPSYSTKAASAIEFQNEVWLQRRIELWGEGFSMSDIMRLGKNIVRVRPGVSTNVPEAFQFNLAANDGWLLMRIPQKETNSNLGIPTSANNNEGSQPIPGSGSGLTDGITD